MGEVVRDVAGDVGGDVVGDVFGDIVHVVVVNIVGDAEGEVVGTNAKVRQAGRGAVRKMMGAAWPQVANQLPPNGEMMSTMQTYREHFRQIKRVTSK